MIYVWNTRKKKGIPLASVDPGVANVKSGIKYAINGVAKIGTYSPTLTNATGFFPRTPNVVSALCDWFQPMQFVQVLKTVVNFKTVEIPTSINFKGMWQPFTAQQLYTMPNINTAWSWFTLHCCTEVNLKVDDVVIYKTKQYRVKAKVDFTEYGYIEYHIILDYTGAGPLP